MKRKVSVLRCFGVWAAVTAAMAMALGLISPVLTNALQPAWWSTAFTQAISFDELLVRVGALTLSATGAWLWVIVTLTCSEAALSATELGSIRSPRLGDGWTRRLVLFACGAAVLAGSTTPGYAAEELRDRSSLSQIESTPGQRATSTSLLAGLPLPRRVAVAPSAAQGPAAKPVAVQRSHSTRVLPSRARATHTVVAGESLWSIARTHLPGSTSSGEVARAWRTLYRANRSTIGTNPDRIFPGQQLTLQPITNEPSAPKETP